MSEAIEIIEPISAFIALTSAAVMLLMNNSDDADMAFPAFAAMLLASGGIMILCELASSITKGA